jgi:hypothetical protein
MQAEDLDTLFMLPSSEQGLDKLESLQQQLKGLSFDPDDTDTWVLTWGNT